MHREQTLKKGSRRFWGRPAGSLLNLTGSKLKNACRSWLILLAVVAFLGQAPDLAAQCDTPWTEIYKKVSKSVVMVTAVGINPFSVTERVSTSVGSGFIVQADGLILTNSHVIFGRQSVWVTLDDGSSIPAAIVGADPILDLAALQIHAPGEKLPVLSMAGDRLPLVGEEVIAMGNPLGFEQTLTRGVVSGVNRVLPISPMSFLVPMIQTDAAINSGNSGGPLVNRCGEAVGINTSVLAGAENMGFALPATIIRSVLDELVKNGRVARPWLGFRGRLIKKDEMQEIFNIDLQDGFLVEMVEPGSPAEAKGLQGGMLPVKIAGEEFLFGGDIIVRVNGRPIAEPETYEAFVRNLKIGEKVKLNVYREGRETSVTLNVVERPILPWDLPTDQYGCSGLW